MSYAILGSLNIALLKVVNEDHKEHLGVRIPAQSNDTNLCLMVERTTQTDEFASVFGWGSLDDNNDCASMI